MWKVLRFLGGIFILLPIYALREFAWWLDGWTPKAVSKIDRWIIMWGRK